MHHCLLKSSLWNYHSCETSYAAKARLIRQSLPQEQSPACTSNRSLNAPTRAIGRGKVQSFMACNSNGHGPRDQP